MLRLVSELSRNIKIYEVFRREKLKKIIPVSISFILRRTPENY